MKQLSLEWTKHIHDPEKKQLLEGAIRNSGTALSRLLDLLNEWENDLTKQECNIKEYDVPNWRERQAHRNGDRSRIRKLKDLLSFLIKE